MDDLVTRYSPLVWSIARTYCHSLADAEEATQEAVTRLWRSASRFDPQRSPEAAFVVLVARSTILDYVRSQRARRRLGAEERPVRDAAAEPPVGAARAMEFAEESKMAQAILAKLSPEQQAVIRLAVHRGLTQSAIAQALGIPLGTVKTRTRAAIAALRLALDDYRTRGPWLERRA